MEASVVVSSHNTSTVAPPLYNSFLYPHFYKCSSGTAGAAVFTSFTCTSFLLLVPLNGLVCAVGVRRWRRRRRRRRRRSSASSNSDFLTYNMIAMEPAGLAAAGVYCCGMYAQQVRLMKSGVHVVFMVYLGRLLFQCLTCVEHYLAVVQPVAYLRLRSQRGVRLRNGCVGFIWLLSLVMLTFVASFCQDVPSVTFFSFFAFGLLVITFCSSSVLLALVRPGPGDRKRVDQSKRRAFLNVAVITAVIFLKYAGLLVCTALHGSALFDSDGGCVLLMSSFWFCLPSSLSLLFLHRAGKLPWAGGKAGGGQRVTGSPVNVGPARKPGLGRSGNVHDLGFPSGQ